MTKFLGFLLGVAVALAGPAVFGVLAAPGGIELNTKEMALAYGIGALIFWAVVSYFSGAAALGALTAFGTLVYCWLWIPNRTTNFLNDVPGVTTGMIEGSRQYTLNGVVPILTVISLVYAIQLIVRSVQRRRRERAEAERLQREQEVAQAQQEADAAALHPVAGSTYPAEGGGYAGAYGSGTRYDDLFDEDPEPVRPRSQADEQTAQYPVSAPDQTAQYPTTDARSNESGDDTVLVPTDRDETTQVPVTEPPTQQPVAEAPGQEPVAEAPTQEPVAKAPTQEPVAEAPQQEPVAEAPRQEPVAEAPKQERVAEAPQQEPVAEAPKQEPVTDAPHQEPVADAPKQKPVAEAPRREPERPTAVAPAVADEPTVTAPVAGRGTNADAPEANPVEPGAPSAESPQTEQPKAAQGSAEKPVEPRTPAVEDSPGPKGGGEEPVHGGKKVEARAVPVGDEQVGQQYRERMEDPEDTGEFHFNAFESPAQVSIRPAGA
ncbi:hypothetical protein [Kribbella sp. CA-247076]|uniref:hypothetical protein n=1 Tax=Kribbella sp. CA-247076 TaxID=3239941 RepID=UPI003D8B74E4